MKNTFFISTAIDYPSAPPHAGHMYEKICADVIARWMRLSGLKVHFSTGLDCHGLKIQRAAEKNNKNPKQFVDDMSKYFLQLCKEYNISYDDFIMTTEKRHEKVVNYILKELYEKKVIYKGEYEGSYCVDCETFYTETEAPDKKCPIHKKSLEVVKEDGYFFKMSKYNKFLLGYMKKNKDYIIPNQRSNEIINRLKDDIRDLNITREKVSWGIPFILDKNLTTAIWVEALINYLTTIDYPNKNYKEYWPGIHIIGNDILWHHTIIFGSLLKALDLDMPQILVHGFIRSSTGEKMSKSLGNIIDPLELSKKYDTDIIRYYLLRSIPFGDDGDFSEEALIRRNNTELADSLGNLLNRVVAMCEKYFDSKIPIAKEDKSLSKKLDFKKIDSLIQNYELHNALSEIFSFIDECNKYINDKAPWNLAKNNEQEKLKTVMFNLGESLRIISQLIYPFMPETAEKINEQLGFKLRDKFDLKWGNAKSKGIKRGEMLFKKIEK